MYVELSPANINRYYRAHPPGSKSREPEVEDGVVDEIPPSIWVAEFLE